MDEWLNRINSIHSKCSISVDFYMGLMQKAASAIPEQFTNIINPFQNLSVQTYILY